MACYQTLVSMVAHCCLHVVGCTALVDCCHLLIVALSVGGLLFHACCWLLWLLVVRCWLLVLVACWWSLLVLVVRYWLLVLSSASIIGACMLLVLVCCLLVVGGCCFDTFCLQDTT